MPSGGVGSSGPKPWAKAGVVRRARVRRSLVMGESESVQPTLATMKPLRRWGTQHVGAVFNRIDGFVPNLVEWAA